jgi:conjugal transfer pilus assembly protein TraE
LKASIFSKNFDSAVASAKLLMLVVICLVILNIFFGIALLRSRTQTILVPPNMDHSVRIGYAEADADYYKSWGLYVAEMVGNLTPGNANFVSTALGRLFSSSDYQKVTSAVLAQGQSMAHNGVVSFFKAEAVIWEPQTSRVFVTGTRREVSPNGNASSVQTVTYQMRVSMSAGQPVLDQFITYEGQAHTLAWEKANPGLAAQDGSPATPASAASSS